MVARTMIILSLLASSLVGAHAARKNSLEDTIAVVEQRSKEVAARQGLDPDTVRDIPKILQAASGLVIALITAFNEEEPDLEYALENLNLQGWQLVKSIVPKDKQGSTSMKNAKVAWDGAFADLPDVIESIQASYKSGDTKAGLEAVLKIMAAGLKAAATVDTDEAKYINAIADLTDELGHAAMSFGTEMGVFGASSLAQIEAGSQLGRWDADSMNKLMTYGAGLATTFLAAANEDPPDFNYAISSFKIQGWQMAKILVPKDTQKQDSFKKAKKAWDQVFADAPGLTEKAVTAYNEGKIDQTIEVVVGTLNSGLKAAAVVDESQATKFNAMAALIDKTMKSLLKFSHTIGWLN